MKTKFLHLTLLASLLVYAPLSQAMMFGQAPTSGSWDGIKSYITTQLLQSNLVIVLASLSLLGGIWQLSHGRGFGFLGTVVFVIAAAAVGPNVIDTAATVVVPQTQHVSASWLASTVSATPALTRAAS